MAFDTVHSTEIDADSTVKQALPAESPCLRADLAVGVESRPTAPQTRQNNIGFIRLLAASMVIVSHSAELIDGDRGSELLSRMFGTLSFGELGVDIFFLVEDGNDDRELVVVDGIKGARGAALPRRRHR